MNRSSMYMGSGDISNEETSAEVALPQPSGDDVYAVPEPIGSDALDELDDELAAVLRDHGAGSGPVTVNEEQPSKLYAEPSYADIDDVLDGEAILGETEDDAEIRAILEKT